MSEFAEGFKAGSVSMGRKILILLGSTRYFYIGACAHDIKKLVVQAETMDGKEKNEVE